MLHTTVVAECEISLGGGGQGNIRQISTFVFTMTKRGWGYMWCLSGVALPNGLCIY
jgi:hypothetical protein